LSPALFAGGVVGVAQRLLIGHEHDAFALLFFGQIFLGSFVFFVGEPLGLLGGDPSPKPSLRFRANPPSTLPQGEGRKVCLIQVNPKLP
jgi:hypothetical protein